jgi:acetylornithine deacetylase/succinyl-diaminopimelate desuccinylase-like protein
MSLFNDRIRAICCYQAKMSASLLKGLPLLLLLGYGVFLPRAIADYGRDPLPIPAPVATGLLNEITPKLSVVAPLPMQVKPEVASIVKELVKAPSVRQALALIKSDQARFVKESIQISEIPAPTFQEAKRAQAFAALLKANGLTDVRIDSINNVIGLRKGTGNGPAIAIMAHLDTVFDATTDVEVKKKGIILSGPGLADDSAALASMLSWLRAMNQTKIATPGDLYFVATVGEEAAGDLRGARQFFKDHSNIAGAVILEGVPVTYALIAQNATLRLEVSFKGPGGHAYIDYGKVPSAVHAMGRLIAKMADMSIPAKPLTTFNVGTAKGGDYVSKIAPSASIKIETRSLSRQNVDSVARQVQVFARQAVDEENRRWGVMSLSMSVKEIASRVGGMTPADHPIVFGWIAAAQQLGIEPRGLGVGSTDGAVPLAAGIPTLVLGFGGITGGFHAIDENWNPTNAYKGVQLSFLTTLAMAGVDGVSQPLVPTR